MTHYEGDILMDQDSDEMQTNRVCSEVLFGGSEGFGYGTGTISRDAQLDSGELTPEADKNAASFIQQNPLAFIAIDKEATDDGCGDGRVCAKIYQLVDVMGERQVVEYKTSLNRAKVFGGGIVMTQAALLAANLHSAQSSYDLFAQASSVLDEKGIKYGAHTDQHAHGDNCGCGAIDKMPIILANISRYDNEIKGTLSQLMGDGFDEVSFAAAVQHMKTAFTEIDFSDYRGSKIMDNILDSGAVVKQLNGDHQEDFVVLNFQEGTTFNQRGFFEFTENKAQAFCVDVWRLQKYAQAISGDAKVQSEALYGMLIYTLATSATLTDGSQRVFINQAA